MEQFYTEFKRDNNSRMKYIGPFSKEVADSYTQHYLDIGYMHSRTVTADERYRES